MNTPNRALLFATLVAALGGLLFGFDTVVISGTQSQLVARFDLSGFAQGFVTASALIGTIIGALTAGKPGDLWGRRDSLKVAAILYLISALGCAFSWDVVSLVAFRMIGGVGVGASSVLGPLYLAEISPAKWRGRLVSFFQFNVVLGILVAFLSNYLVGLMDFGDAEWRWKLGVEAIPAMAFFIMLFYIPASPRWLVMRQRIDEATAVLRLFHDEGVKRHIGDILHSLHQEGAKRSEPIFRRIYLKPILLAWGVAMFNQLSGINALLYYMNPIFDMAGFDKVSGDLQSVLIGATNLLFTLLGMAIIDKAGRKKLLMIGSLGTAACLGGAALIFNSGTMEGALVWVLVGYIAFFAFSQGAVIWVYISEVFPNEVRAKGQSLGSFTHWFMAAVVSWLFPVFARGAGEPGAGSPFFFFAFMMALQFFIVWRYFPETKGVPLEEMRRRLGIGGGYADDKDPSC